VNFILALTVFVIIFLAELPDKTRSPAWCSGPATGRCTYSRAAAAASGVHVVLAAVSLISAVHGPVPLPAASSYLP
jgi:hypothetical protein